MKEKKLMIGDWVYDKKMKRYGRVDRLEHDIEDDTVEPIPLTAEILKKNGFVLKDYSSNHKHFLWTTGWIDNYADVHVTCGKDEYFVWRWDNLDLKLNFCSGYCNLFKLHYVHELQHVLRLCKIDKEIEL